MGIFDWFTGTKRPAAGVEPGALQEVHAALLATNRPEAPFLVRDGTPEGVDLVAEWKIADSHWYGYFGHLTRTNQTFMRLNPSKNEVRAVDREWDVTWLDGVPQLALSKESGRGQINKVSCDITFSRDERGKLGKESIRTFSSAELKHSLRESVVGAGWIWRGVALGKL